MQLYIHCNFAPQNPIHWTLDNTTTTTATTTGTKTKTTTTMAARRTSECMNERFGLIAKCIIVSLAQFGDVGFVFQCTSIFCTQQQRKQCVCGARILVENARKHMHCVRIECTWAHIRSLADVGKWWEKPSFELKNVNYVNTLSVCSVSAQQQPNPFLEIKLENYALTSTSITTICEQYNNRCRLCFALWTYLH